MGLKKAIVKAFDATENFCTDHKGLLKGIGIAATAIGGLATFGKSLGRDEMDEKRRQRDKYIDELMKKNGVM